jgi:hypothetical protein
MALDLFKEEYNGSDVPAFIAVTLRHSSGFLLRSASTTVNGQGNYVPE